ncbi:MAG TPA: glycine/sarcosine/betaine reductase complex component C subunit beta [Candidatus Acidoferrales bacterium]|nr:glycine/sarcosine/betaine reductase complex component C subunit beta [Candidatus Acidoferrales bacterium]
MNESPKAVRVGIAGVFYSLTHVPDLVCYGSKPSRETKNNPAIGAALKAKLRSFPEVAAYAPHQVYIGNVTPEGLGGLPKPWYEKLIEGASRQGRFGDLVDQSRFYGLLAASDQFELVSFEEKWFVEQAAGQSTNGRKPRLRSIDEIKALCDKGAFPLWSGDLLVGAFEAGHAEDANLTPDVLLENLAAKVTAAHALRSLLNNLKLHPGGIDFVISCSEEAVGDRYNRGGGNLAKAIAEDVGCENASGSDTKAFCAGPLYAMVHGACLIQSGVCRKVAVVAGGSLAKLGMKFESHLKKGMPILEDVLGSFAVVLEAAKPDGPCVRLDSAAFHPVRAGGSPQAMAEFLAEKPLEKLGMKLTDVDRYAVELHNPEITVPSGSGDVPRTNYLTLAALAVMRGQIQKSQMEDFIRARGMVGYAPTQGHIPSAIVYLGHALDALREGKIRNALFISKGSLFLGRMTQLSDGCSFLVENCPG